MRPAAAAIGLPDRVPICIMNCVLGHGALVEVRHDVGAAGDGRQREAAADRLAERADVGRNAVVGLRAAVGEAEAGHDLVEDQHQAVLLR